MAKLIGKYQQIPSNFFHIHINFSEDYFQRNINIFLVRPTHSAEIFVRKFKDLGQQEVG